MPGLGVHLDDGDVRAERKGRVPLELVCRLQLDEPLVADGARGQLGPGEGRLGRAGDVEAAERQVENDVVGARLEIVGDELLRLLDDRVAATRAAVPPICVDFEP